MKILILTDRLDVGGAETHIAELALGLRRMGDEVDVLSAGGRTADRLTQLGFSHIRLELCTHNPIRLLLLRRKLRSIIRQNRYDVIHAHARIPALLLRGKKATQAARIVTVHAHFRQNAWLRKLCYWGERTIAVSEDLRTYLCDTYGISGERVRVIANGIDCARFSPIERSGTDTVRVLFASRLDADCSCGASLLCALAPSLCRAFPQLEIGIVGGGDQLAVIRAAAAHVNRLLQRDCVKVYGQIDDMASLLQQQNIFIGVSRVAMEAAACGCAVILCGDEGYLGILTQKNAKNAILSNFCCRGEEKAKKTRLERDLRLLIQQSALCRRLGLEAREVICKDFDASDMCTKTRALYLRVIHPPYRRRVLAGGYFGCGNAGDDAILQGFLDGMHAISPETEICALTADPNRAEKRFGIRCIERKNPIAVRYALHRSELFVCGGGSLLQNATSNRSLHYYLSLLRMAKRAHCKTILYAAGIGPIRGERAKKAVAKGLRRCDYISLRDPDSLRFLIGLGMDRARLHESADPALLMPLPPSTRTTALLREQGLPDRQNRLCVILRRLPPDNEPLLRSFATAVHLLCKRHRLTPVFLLFCAEDETSARSVCRIVGGTILHPRAIEDLTALLRDSRLILSMRLHALILAAATATPAIGISIDPTDQKISSFARLSGQESLAYPHPSVGELVELSERQLSTKAPQKSERIAQAVEELRKKACKDLENIIKILYNKDNVQTPPTL